MKKFLWILAVLVLCAGAVRAADKPLMHCFAFTQIDAASADDWQAFAKATEALPGKIPGLTKIWHGKLARPMGLTQPAGDVSQEDIKKLRAGEIVTVPVKMIRRQYGVCMEFTGPDALAAYAKQPAHDDWMKVYEKVRVAGTTTVDIVGQ